MKNTTELCSLREGEKCCVRQLAMTGKMRSRLMDLGLTSGAEVECLHISSGGDPAAYLISGAVIAIRRQDARNIIVSR